MMGQRKLTLDERSRIDLARSAIAALPKWSEISGGEDLWIDALIKLSDMATNGTTDGKPYVKPQPEIGEGYRPATEADAWRKDVEYFSSLNGSGWFPRAVHGKPLESSDHYRVPIDRIPTDEDAVGRPTVMVQDGVSGEWVKAFLLAVTNDDTYPFCVLMDGDVDSWMDCRFPYPGELD
jgi:hypothetical protein